MRPKDLKSPFSWKEREIIIQDRVWYVPPHCENDQKFLFPGWVHPQMFVQDFPIYLEFCSGNGDWIASKAKATPECNWVAIEKKFDRVKKIWSKIKNHSLNNLMAICGEGYHVTRNYIPTHSVQAVFINFPDPWPKNRHAKNRLICVPFINEIYRILHPSGFLTMVTDDESYSTLMIQVLHQVSGFKSLFEPPHFMNEYPFYGSSYFEDLWRKKGKKIRYHAFVKRK